MQTIVVIGAGFCGALTAAQLLRRAGHTPTRVVLLNRSGPMARGVAYGTRSDCHVLNVPAARMGAFLDDEGGFLRFLRQRDPAFDGGSFAPRSAFGDYLEAVLDDAIHHPVEGNSFEAVSGSAAAVEPLADGSGATVRLEDGRELQADKVVLALGHFAPRNPPVALSARRFYDSPRYLRDPWAPDALRAVDPRQPTLLIGSGLTMLDVLLGLRQQGITAPVIAISRRGLLPLAHREHGHAPQYRSSLPAMLERRPRLRHYLRELRQEVARAAEQGVDWRDVIGALRAHTPWLWQALPQREQERFLRHLRGFWDVHRHRCAPQAGAALAAELASGGLRIVAGRLVDFQEQDGAVTACYRPRGGTGFESLTVGTVINCTGPDSDLRSSAEPLMVQLRNAGLLTPDPLNLGLLTSEEYQLIDAQGSASPVLHYVGPLLRAQHWEATAVPELRRHVSLLVDVLSSPPAQEIPRDWDAATCGYACSELPAGWSPRVAPA